jgi:hypothetical protein
MFNGGSVHISPLEIAADFKPWRQNKCSNLNFPVEIVKQSMLLNNIKIIIVCHETILYGSVITFSAVCINAYSV